MIPLRDENPTRRFPVVTVTLVALNVIVFAYGLSLLAQGVTAYERFVFDTAFIPQHLFDTPLSPAVWGTVFTAMFMHQGILHIGGNMLYLWIFGNNIEDALGRIPFLAFYLGTGVAAALAQAFVGGDPSIPTLGASGAVAGVLGAYILLFPKARVLVAIVIVFFIELASVPAFFVIGFWFVIQLANGVLSLGPDVARQGGVAYLAHLGGFAAGLVAAAPVALIRRSRPTRQRTWS